MTTEVATLEERMESVSRRLEQTAAQLSDLGLNVAGLAQIVDTMAGFTLLQAEADDLHDAVQDREQKLLQSDILGMNRQILHELQEIRNISLAVRGAATGEGGQDQQADPLPAILDMKYAQGIIPVPGDEPVRHTELVSIIMPSYNNEAWLARAIHSALSQVGVNIELLVVDDGSTDGSVALARGIAATVPNMRVISLLRNFGCYYARNIGVLNAKGTYIATIDSDDIMHPDYIARHLDILKVTPGAIACRSQQRRWSSDYSQPLSSLKAGEISLIWPRKIVANTGYYDTVKFSGDAEFRFRLQCLHGEDSIVIIPDELYFPRTLDNSLTTAAASRVFALENNTLKVQMSPQRKVYYENFKAWQTAGMAQAASDSKAVHIDFPLFSRPFPLGTPAQNASPSLGQRRVGAMASYPPRREALQAVIESILPQLDELILYLNDYDDVPEFVKNPRIRIYRSQEEKGDLRDNGKFYDLPSGDAYIFTLDDDLIYPPDYVAQMIHHIEMLGRSSVVGLHGVIFPAGNFDHLDQRTVFYFESAHTGHFVDLLGTGTTAWHSSTLQIGLGDFASSGVCDLWFAAAAARQEIPLFSVPRDQGWLRLYRRFEESLYTEALDNPEGYFEPFKRIVAPALRGGAVRRRMEAHLACAYDRETLAAAGMELREIPAGPATKLLPVRRSLVREKSPGRPCADDFQPALNFHIVINGWNCYDYVDRCLRSIAGQLPGPYAYEVTLIDDGSTDNSFEKLAAASILPGARLIRIEENAGPAYARHIGISAIPDPETVVVLVDMDDELEPDALRTVARRYLENPACLLTIGNWLDQHGEINPQPFYSADEIDGQRIRTVESFNATHLRTFRRKLYNAIRPDDLYGPDGNWLETCTDVALMYSLLDQCWSNEVEFISEPIYRYNREHGMGTLARFGKPHKEARLDFLKARPSKPRFNVSRQ